MELKKCLPKVQVVHTSVFSKMDNAEEVLAATEKDWAEFEQSEFMETAAVQEAREKREGVTDAMAEQANSLWTVQPAGTGESPHETLNWSV